MNKFPFPTLLIGILGISACGGSDSALPIFTSSASQIELKWPDDAINPEDLAPHMFLYKCSKLLQLDQEVRDGRACGIEDYTNYVDGNIRLSNDHRSILVNESLTGQWQIHIGFGSNCTNTYAGYKSILELPIGNRKEVIEIFPTLCETNSIQKF